MPRPREELEGIPLEMHARMRWAYFTHRVLSQAPEPLILQLTLGGRLGRY